MEGRECCTSTKANSKKNKRKISHQFIRVTSLANLGLFSFARPIEFNYNCILLMVDNTIQYNILNC